ncbi:MAG TPA: SRPBCC family protein [Nitriliruptoraceae bacterium]|nr:SRPBCC family protein [Nitriliruptoraceae bacterium]
MRLDVDTTIAAPIEDVWSVLVEWEAQRDWMLDAKEVVVVTPERSGHGVTIHVPTSLLGLPVLDVMRVTGWDPPHRLEATHLGRVIKGVGAFEMTPVADDVTHLLWWEEIDAPLGAVGEFGAGLALPVIRAIFTKSLDRFRRVVESRVRDTP